jgi:hypothetical protein
MLIPFAFARRSTSTFIEAGSRTSQVLCGFFIL